MITQHAASCMVLRFECNDMNCQIQTNCLVACVSMCRYFWATPVGEGRTALVVFSASAYGHGDLGVNRARVDKWISAIESEMKSEVKSR